MQRVKKIATCLVVAMLSAWLPWAPAFAHPEATAGQKYRALVARTSPSTTVARPQQQQRVVVKRVWVGGAPWLGGHEATVVEKAAKTCQIRTGQGKAQIQPRRVWVGGAPWLGGHEATVVEKAPETRQIQTGRGQAEIQPRRVWVGGAPWLGGYETWVTPK